MAHECFELMYVVLAELRRACQILLDWSYGQVWVAMWVLGTEPESSIRTSALDH